MLVLCCYQYTQDGLENQGGRSNFVEHNEKDRSELRPQDARMFSPMLMPNLQAAATPNASSMAKA